MNSLMPVKKMDKNGKLVTRHIRQDEPKASRAPLPPPSVTTGDKGLPLHVLAEKVEDATNEIKIADLDDVEIGHLSEIAKHLKIGADKAVLWRLLNPSSMAKVRHMDSTEIPPIRTDLRNLALFHRMDQGVALNETLGLSRGLHRYNLAPVVGLGNDEKNRAVIDLSIAAMTMLMDQDNPYRDAKMDTLGDYVVDEDAYLSCFGGDLDDANTGDIWLRNDKLVDLIDRRHGDVDRIIDIINLRKTVQPDTIEALLDSGAHSSMISGAL